MKFNYFIIIFCALFLGYLCAAFAINSYNESNTYYDLQVYFLQIGAYSNIETLNKDLNNIKDKLTIKENNKYYSYIGITTNLSIAQKIKDLYKKENIDIYIKKVDLDNEDLYSQLVQYDVLLKNSNSIDEIKSILKTINACYEENMSNI